MNNNNVKVKKIYHNNKINKKYYINIINRHNQLHNN